MSDITGGGEPANPAPAGPGHGCGTYSIHGRQVEPSAGYWAVGGQRIQVVEVDQLIDAKVIGEFDCRPDFLEEEITELEHLAANRDKAGILVPGGDFKGRVRKPLSRFFYLRPPLGAVVPIDRFNDAPKLSRLSDQCEEMSKPIVRTGRELARLFEDETPGLLHRHALNCLLLNRNVSPPRQARVWMALDITIYSALLAAWHYKWANTEIGSSKPDDERVFRERPREYADRTRTRRDGTPWNFSVLYDTKVEDNGSGDGELRCPDPANPTKPNPRVSSPGTPRHPAFPSGHSTYSAAASAILAHFFQDDPDVVRELDHLADNIGVARLWAGVHWRQDHVQGQKLGRAVAQKVIEQLQADPVVPARPGPPAPCDTTRAPTFSEVRADGRGPGSKDQDVLPRPSPSFLDQLSPNRGA